MRVLVATTNPHKVREIEEVLSPLGIEVTSLASIDVIPPEPEEDRVTFAENAHLKALYYATRIGRPCLGEDSGLVVDALGGAPGVHSARYAGASGTREDRDRANNEKLLSELRGVPASRRTARFVCAMCLCSPGGRTLATATGTYEGLIADAPRGSNGFGYDPLLVLADLGRTSAELSPAEKNARSHRGQAARELAVRLRELVSTAEGRAALS